MRLAAFRVRLHMRFYLVLILVVLTLLTAMATGFGLVTKLLNTLLLVMALSYFWNWLTVTSLEVKVDRLTRKAQVGDTIEEVMIVRNQLGIPKHALEVEDRTDLPGYSGGMVLSLSGNATRYWRVRTTARKRGVYTLGPVRIANTDPFGLFRRERLLGHTDTVTVYPRTFSLPGFEIPSADLLGESSVRKRTHHVTPHASSVREYAFGDSLSRVHWNSTAKLGKLMSKVFDLGHAGEVWVLVDLHRDIQAGEMEESTDEYAVTVGASLAKKYLEAQLPVGLIAHGDQRYYLIAETGAGQMNRILQFLAMSKAEGVTPLEVVLGREEPLWSHNSTLIVITSSPREEWVAAVRELVKRGIRVTAVLVDGSSFGGQFNTLDILDQLYLSGLPSYVVKKGDDIPTALSRKYTGAAAAVPEQLEEAGAQI